MDASSTDASDAAPTRWPCPVDWVPSARGGCGPTVLLCARGGGALPGACDGIDITRSQARAEPDGGVAQSVRVGDDGSVRANWVLPGEPDGPRAADWLPVGSAVRTLAGWSPDAGIPTCPTGWTRTTDGACDPQLPATCPVGSAAIPAARCTHTAIIDCPTTEFPDPGAESVGATRLHVREGADAAVANGSPTRPYATLGAALTAAAPNDWILVAGGTYPERLTVTIRVHVMGVCAARVFVTGDAARTPTFDVIAGLGDLDLRSVTVRGGGIGMYVRPGAHARLERVRVSQSTGVGVLVDAMGAYAQITDSWVDSITPDSGGHSRGLEVDMDATLELRGSAVSATREIGVLATGDHAVIDLEDVRIFGTLRAASGGIGDGVWAQNLGRLAMRRFVVENSAGRGVVAGASGRVAITDGVVRGHGAIPADATGGCTATRDAQVAIERVLFEHIDSIAIGSLGRGARLTVRDSIVRDTEPAPNGTLGNALGAILGGNLIATGVRLERNAEAAVVAHDGAAIEIDDSVIAGTLPRPDGTGGYGLRAEGGTINACRVLVTQNTTTGVSALYADGHLSLCDSVVRDTLPARMIGAIGAAAGDGADVRIVRSVFSGHYGTGLVSAGMGTSLAVSDTIVRDIGTTPSGSLGIGITISRGARIDATRVHVFRARTLGVLAIDAGSVIHIDSSAIRETQPDDHDEHGMGLDVENGATLTASRSAIVGSRQTGVVVAGIGSRMQLDDCLVGDTQSESHGSFGHGALAYLGASFVARRVVFDRNREAGVMAFHAGTAVDLTDVFVTSTAPSAQGLGGGVFAFGAASVRASRLAVQTSAGAALAAAQFIDDVGMTTVGSSIAVRDAWVERVRSNTVAIEPVRHAPTGRAVAYGAHAGDRCAVDLARVVIADGGYGFFVADGSIVVRDGVITGQLDAAGAASGRGTYVTENVSMRGNADDGVRLGASLPTASALAPPSPVCLGGSCF